MKHFCLTVLVLVLLAGVGAPRADASSAVAASASAPILLPSAGNSNQLEPVSQEPPARESKPDPGSVESPAMAEPSAAEPESRAVPAGSAPESVAPGTSPELPEEEKRNWHTDDLESDYVPEEEGEAPVTLYDPLEPFNRAMYHVNDKLYFWLLKPVSQTYGEVVPEPARISVRNFFSNLAFPVRFLSCLLQADFSGAVKESGRFVVNTLWGVGGLLDPSSKNELDLPKQNVDLGQTLGIYGLGPGFYIVWPVLGPSSLRDTVDIAGRHFLSPVSYLNPWYAPMTVRGYEAVNDTSLRIGDYEALKGAAIDPYLSIRDAFAQYRKQKIEARKKHLTKQLPSGEGKMPVSVGSGIE